MHKKSVLTLHAEREGKQEVELLRDVLNNHDTVEEASDWFGVERRTVHKWMKRLNIRTQYVVQTKNPQKSA